MPTTGRPAPRSLFSQGDSVVAPPQRPESLHMPGLFVVGAAKAGTTALYQYFSAHPQVFVPGSIKETNFMAFCQGMPPLTGPRDRQVLARSITRLADYQQLYRARTTEIAAADVSPAYLYYTEAAGRIAALCPRAKIVIVLRNPVEAAFSMFAMMRRDGREPCRDFWTAFERSGERRAAGWEWAWDYQHCHRYAHQVARYLALFPPSQLFIRRYEDFKHRPAAFCRELAEFIGVEPIDLDSGERRQNSAPRRCDVMLRRRAGRILLRAARATAWLAPQSLGGRIRRRLEAPAYELRDRDRTRLIDAFGPDVVQLSARLSWDLRDWLRG